MKYSINGTGNIVAERDIYSLGGFIPKGTVGGKIASEAQLSQDGECWIAGGDMSAHPWVTVSGDAYIGNFIATNVTANRNPILITGDTRIPGAVGFYHPATLPTSELVIKDSFIGFDLDVLCGPRTTATAFPFEQGGYLSTAPRGTAFSSGAIQTSDINLCRSTDAVIRCGLNTYVYLPTGYSGRILWAYTEGGTAVYSGESEILPSGLNKINHPIYKQFMLHVNKIDGTAMTPADLLATGTKILGYTFGSAPIEIRAGSASGMYAMNKSSLTIKASTYNQSGTKIRTLVGGMGNTNCVTGNAADIRILGTFSNVETLEYAKSLGDSWLSRVNRDKAISAYDCPLLRVDNNTYDTSLSSTGDLTLRRCIVPKAVLQNDIVNGNTYEDIDFSYANEDLGFSMAGYTGFISSHRQGLYRLKVAGGQSNGLVSHKGNLADTARLYQAEEYIPLDGSIMEQGFYGGGQAPYESVKSNSSIRVRTGKPLPTSGLVFPSLPAGYSVKAFTYLGEDFITRSLVTDPTGLDTTYPYVVMVFRKDDDSAINVNDFIALNRTLRIIDHTKAPEITGSAYVGAGVVVRGDVKLIGDPYVNRLLDVNMWERGTASQSVGKSWEDSKISTTLGNRFRLMDTFPVEPGGLITCNPGYWVECGFFDSNGIFISSPGWGSTSNYVPAGAAYAGIVIKKATSASESGGLIEDSDIPLANVKYLRAFEKRRYIVNELDRTSPKDILLGPDMWEQGTAGGGQADAGKTYEELKAASGTTIRLKRPINVSPSSSISSASGFSRYSRVLDAVTKFRLGESLASAKMALLADIIQKDPSAAITPSEIPNSRLVLEFVPQPRIIVPYGSATLFISGPKIRMYDNAVLSRNLNQEGEIVLQGDAVMGYDFNSGSCMCSNGHSDAIIKLP